MREIVLDTETTGLDPKTGDRVVEIACLELINHVESGETRRWYLNPEREVPEEAQRIHGLSSEFLADKPRFAEIAEEFIDFILADKLVIHNASFDLKFLNHELTQAGHSPIASLRAVDTLEMARRKFPGAQASLDALCRRFGIDNSARTFHGALLDCQLLAEVYLELVGGRQPGLSLAADVSTAAALAALPADRREARPPRPHAPSAEELAAHDALVKDLKDPLWLK